MPEDSKTLRIFISSPGDVQQERQRVEKAIERLGKQAHITSHFRLNSLLWEEVPPEGGSPPQTTIDRYLGEAGEADIYSCILWHRMGTPTKNAKGESFRSGTECEFFSAYRANAANGKPHILLYHCQRPQSPEIDPEQSKLVKEFLARFKSANPELKGLFHHYTDIDEFEHRITTDLNTIIVKRFLALSQTQTQRCEFYPSTYLQLPTNYVPREELLVELRTALLSNNNALALTSAKAKPTALHGMGGIGKSVMARALCDDPQVRETFPDGILWTTLGQEPNLAEKLREWIHALGGVISENAPTLDQLKNNLNKLLDGRRCLLVVDDVWRKAHAETFRMGSSCRLLLTTRDAAVADDLGALVQPVPLMARAEAVRLLEEWAAGNLRAVDAALKERIVERLGRLPLALRLAGAQLRSRELESWLAAFDVHQLKAKRIEGMHDSLAKTFELSLEALGEMRPLYTALAIFKEDEPIPETALHKLWSGLANFDATQSAELLEDLASRALLTLESKTTPRRASLHDMLRDLIASELNDETRHTHTCLLEAYRTTCGGTGWHTAPDDGYLYNHLVYHLENTHQWDELHALFKDQNWMHVRVPQRDYDYDGYLSDLMVAWQDAHKHAQTQIAAHEVPAALAECVRYALIRTSVNSLAANYESVLVARAVETGLWSPQRAVSLAAKVPDSKQRAEFFVALLATGRLDPNTRALAQRQGLAAAQVIEYKWSVLRVLAPHLTGEEREQVVRELLAFAYKRAHEPLQHVNSKKERTQELAALAPQLTGEILREWSASSEVIKDEKEYVQVLAALAPQLTGESLCEGLAAALKIENEDLRWIVLEKLAPQLTGENLRVGLAAARAIQDDWGRAQTLAAFAPQLTGEEREQVLRDRLAAARAIQDDEKRANALAALTSQLTGEEREQALRDGLAAARVIKGEAVRADALTALASQLPGEEREQALRDGLAAVRAIDDELYRASKLTKLAPQMTGENLREMLAAAREIENEYQRRDLLKKLAPQLTDENLREGLTAVLEIKEQTLRAEVLAALAPQLTGENLRDGLAAARAIDRGSPVVALAALAPRLAGEEREQVLGEALAAALMIGHEGNRAYKLAALAPQLTGENLRKGLAAAQAIKSNKDRAEVLAALAQQFTDKEREQVLREALAAARAVEKAEVRADMLAALAPYLASEEREQILRERLAAAQAIVYDEIRAKALMGLAPQLLGENLREGLAAARMIKDEKESAQALVALAPQLVGKNLREGLEAARAIKYEYERTQMLTALALQLTGEEREQVVSEALAVTRMIISEPTRAQVLTVLAQQLTGENLHEALTMTRAIESVLYRAQVLAALAPRFTGEEREQVLREELTAARVIKDEWTRTRALAALVPQLTLTGEEREQVLCEGLAMASTIRNMWGREVDRAYVLATLARYLTGEEREHVLREGLAAARAKKNEDYRAEVLVALAPQLTDENLREGLAMVRPIKYESHRAGVLVALAPQLTGENLREGLAAARAIESEGARAKVLVALAPQLTGEEREQALREGLAAARAIEKESFRAKMLAALAPQLTGEEPEQVLREALATARTIENESSRVDVLVALAPQLTGEQVHATLLEFIERLLNKERAKILELCTQEKLVTPPILSPEIIAAIAKHIIEICQKWQWLWVEQNK